MAARQWGLSSTRRHQRLAFIAGTAIAVSFTTVVHVPAAAVTHSAVPATHHSVAAAASLPAGVWKALGPAPIGYEPSQCLCSASNKEFLAGAGLHGGHNSGRITGIIAIGSGPHAGRVVAATAGGGIWTSDNNGAKWTPRTDQAPSLAIGSVAEDPSNPEHLIAGMGEGNYAFDSFYGFGILSSTDGGTTWTVQNPTYASSASTSFTGTTAVDTAAAWATNQWAGSTVTAGADSAVVASNTATKLTLSSAWSPLTPGGGSTFTIAVFNGAHIREVAISPSSSNTMYAATTTGLFMTTNGGSSWFEPTADGSYATAVGSTTTSVTSVLVDPNKPADVYIGTRGTPIAESTNSGAGSWTALALPNAPKPNPVVELAVGRSSNPSTLYAALGYGIGTAPPLAMYKSVNAGSTWTQLAPPDYTGSKYAFGTKANREQGSYSDVLAVDPTNASHLLAGGIALVESTDGGSTWSNVNGKPFGSSGADPLHEDEHALAFRPDGKVWIGNDGGVYLYDRSASTTPVTNANGKGDAGLNITQFFEGFTAENGFVFDGAQDNGLVLLSQPSAGCAGSNGSCVNYVIPPATPYDSQGLGCCDGGGTAVVVNPDPNCVCTSWFWTSSGPSPALWEQTDITAPGNNITPHLVANLPPQTMNLVTPVLALPNSADPSNPIVYFGGVGLFRTSNPTASSPTWTLAGGPAGYVSASSITTYGPTTAADPSANWGVNQWAGFLVYSNGSVATVTSNTATVLTMAVGWTGGQPANGKTFAIGKTVSAIAATPDGSTVYVGYNDGSIQVSADGGSTFSNLAVAPPFPFFVSSIAIDPTNPQNISASFVTSGAVVRSGLAFPSTVYVAQFTGGKWLLLNGTLPTVDNGAQVSRVVYDNGAIIAATDNGVYGTLGGSPGSPVVWSKIGSGLPNVQVQDVSLDPATGDLFAVTHGRGAWKLTENGAQVWGGGQFGGLGNGSNTQSRDVPGWVLTSSSGQQLRNVTAVASGYAHNLALLSNSSVESWGFNNTGQLGDGNGDNSSLPVKVCALGAAPPCTKNVLTGIAAIAAGDPVAPSQSDNGGDSLVLTKGGNVLAWGTNEDGELGNGTLSNSSVPVQVCAVGAAVPCGGNILSSVTAISAGGGQNLALLSNGTVVAWGDNSAGQLGNGSGGAGSCGNAEACAEVPVQVAGLAGIVAIAAGGRHSLALQSDGTVWAWGRGADGELGNGSFGGSNVPVAVSLPAGVRAVSIAAGGGFSMALLSNGTVLTWGDNTVGELGDGLSGNANNSNVPVQVCAVGATAPCGSSVLNGVTAIATEGNFALALISDPSDDSAVRSWGSGGLGQLGNASAFDKSTPQVVCAAGSVDSLSGCSTGELTGATRIAAGASDALVTIG